MILKDVRAVTSVNPPDISNLGFGVSQVGAEYNLGQYQSGTWYEQSNVDSTGPVWIEISWDRPQTDIALLDENNIERKIYLPASTDTGNLTYAEYYWIAEDGSSYFAHSSHGRGWPDLSYYEALVQEHLARASPIPIIACTDSDGGKNYYVYGEVDYGDGTGAADTCNDMEQNVLIENYCENTVRKWINYECPNGCENGACVKDETLFYIADISGMKSTYNAGDKIKLIVKGIESDGSPASDEEGYNVQYYTYSTSNPDYYLQEFIPSGNYNGRYDDGYWYLEYWAPKKAGKYYTEVILYCSRENSECWLPSNRGGKEYRKKLYFTVTDSAKECTDSDGGKEYYVKGSISGKYIETNQDVDIDDVCTLNEQLIGSCEEGSNCKLVEYYCENGYVNLITYECPNGCKYGACIKLENECSVKTEMNYCLDDKNCYWDQETDGCWEFDSSKQLCSDPDNGRNYEVQAHTWGFDEYAPDDKNARIRRGGKDGCTSSNRLIEHYCDKAYYIKTEYYSCPNSCKDGVCTGGPPQGIYVKLGEKFSLAEKGEAKLHEETPGDTNYYSFHKRNF